jgi:hypothetical protein
MSQSKEAHQAKMRNSSSSGTLTLFGHERIIALAATNVSNIAHTIGC